MSYFGRALIQCCLLVLIISCSGAPQTIPAQASNLLVATNGTVRLKRNGWKDFVPVAAGVHLTTNDLLEVQGSATILCAGPTVKIVTAVGKPPCPTEQSLFTYDNAHFNATQRGVAPDIPYIIFPRKTLVIEPYPLLIWHTTQAASYTVAIVDTSGSVVWQQTGINGSSTQYPRTAPALQPGIDYLLVITDANNKSSADDPAKGLGFRVLSEAQRITIQQQQQALAALNELDAPAQQLALAVYLATWSKEAGRSLWGEAWLQFQEVAKTRNTPALQLWMGDMLQAINLTDESDVAYQQALQQAQATGDQERAADAEAGLWRVLKDTTHRDAAIKRYQDLGDKTTADTLRLEAP